MDVRGKTFLVTGGSSGLGAACVRRFAAAGARVVIADLNREAGQQLAAQLGDGVRIAATDVSAAGLQLHGTGYFRDRERADPVEALGKGPGEAGGHVLRDEDRPWKIGGEGNENRLQGGRTTRRSADENDAFTAD